MVLNLFLLHFTFYIMLPFLVLHINPPHLPSVIIFVQVLISLIGALIVV